MYVCVCVYIYIYIYINRFISYKLHVSANIGHQVSIDIINYIICLQYNKT